MNEQRVAWPAGVCVGAFSVCRALGAGPLVVVVERRCEAACVWSKGDLIKNARGWDASASKLCVGRVRCGGGVCVVAEWKENM